MEVMPDALMILKVRDNETKGPIYWPLINGETNDARI